MNVTFRDGDGFSPSSARNYSVDEGAIDWNIRRSLGRPSFPTRKKTESYD